MTPAPVRGPAPVAMIVNARSHRNRAAGQRPAPEGVLTAYPDTLDDVDAAVARFAAERVGLLVIDGGDGTVRDVLSAAARHFHHGLPRIAILPSGKTNALAIDLDVPPDWTLEAALACAAQGSIRQRSSLEVWRSGADAPEHCGFLFGTAVFVRATQSAQRAHRLGAFDTLAVAATLAVSAVRTLFGGPWNQWRAGEPTGLSIDGSPLEVRARFLVMASTLKRLPLGLKPFGRPREGMKVLSVDAPPRRLAAALPQILAGKDPAWLAAAGYRRADATSIRLTQTPQYVLDGDLYAGGDIIVRAGALLEFVAPPRPN